MLQRCFFRILPVALLALASACELEAEEDLETINSAALLGVPPCATTTAGGFTFYYLKPSTVSAYNAWSALQWVTTNDSITKGLMGSDTPVFGNNNLTTNEWYDFSNGSFVNYGPWTNGGRGSNCQENGKGVVYKVLGGSSSTTTTTTTTPTATPDEPWMVGGVEKTCSWDGDCARNLKGEGGVCDYDPGRGTYVCKRKRCTDTRGCTIYDKHYDAVESCWSMEPVTPGSTTLVNTEYCGSSRSHAPCEANHTQAYGRYYYYNEKSTTSDKCEQYQNLKMIRCEGGRQNWTYASGNHCYQSSYNGQTFWYFGAACTHYGTTSSAVVYLDGTYTAAPLACQKVF